MKVSIKEYILLLKKYLRPYKKKLIILAALMTGSIVLQLINPQIVRFFIDEAAKGDSAKHLISAALAFIGISLIKQLVVVASTYVSQDVGWSSTNALREDLLEHCISLDMSFHKSHLPGELQERLDGDVSSLFSFFSRLLFNLINNFALILGIITLLFIEDWRVGLGLSMFCIIGTTILYKVQPIAVKSWSSSREMSANFFGFIGEQISSTEDIRSSGAFHNTMHRFYEFLRRWYPIRRKSGTMGYLVWITIIIVFAFGNIVAFGIGGYLWLKGAITIGTVYLIFYYTELLNRPIEQIRHQLQELQVAGASVTRIKELFDMKPTIKEGEVPLKCMGPVSIKIENLHFEYEINVPVLKDISIELEPGKILGVLGRTGSGKTTLARLLVRLFEPTNGEIYIDGKLLSSIQLKSLREHVAYVTQDVQLFNATVRENLTLFNHNIGDEVIINAIKDVGLDTWLDNLPDGLDTMIDCSGGGLSAGEAQLLAFVRVFLRNPAFIILDEASSRLDPITEKLIEKAIDKLLKNTTCMIIAHRISTVERADYILVLEDGCVAEFGNRIELMSDKNSKFSKLLRMGIEEVLA